MNKIFLILIIGILFLGCIQEPSKPLAPSLSQEQKVAPIPQVKTAEQIVDEKIDSFFKDKDTNAITVGLLVLDELGYQNPELYIDENIFVFKTTSGYQDLNALDELLFIMYKLDKNKKEYWIYLYPDRNETNVSYEYITLEDEDELLASNEEIPVDISQDEYQVIGVDNRNIKDYIEEKITMDELIDNSYYRSYVYG